MFFIANFQLLMDQQKSDEAERRHGTFSMIVQSASMTQALEDIRRRLERFRETSSLFTGHCRLFLQQVVEFSSLPDGEAVLLNYKSYAGDPILPFIGCVVPTEQSDACQIHEWQQNRPVTEGQADRLFVEFGA